MCSSHHHHYSIWLSLILPPIWYASLTVNWLPQYDIFWIKFTLNNAIKFISGIYRSTIYNYFWELFEFLCAKIELVISDYFHLTSWFSVISIPITRSGWTAKKRRRNVWSIAHNKTRNWHNKNRCPSFRGIITVRSKTLSRSPRKCYLVDYGTTILLAETNYSN